MGWLPPVSGATVAWHRALSAILILLLFCGVFARYSLRWRQSLADELAAARDEAIHHNTLKDQFIAHLNHEIRTPLNALATATEVLSQQQLAPLPAHAGQCATGGDAPSAEPDQQRARSRARSRRPVSRSTRIRFAWATS